MTKSQNQTWKMFQLVEELLDGTETSILDGLPGFQPYKVEFKSNNTKINSQYILQSRNITGFALNKKEHRVDMINQAIDISNKIVAFASNTGDSELKKDMRYPLTVMNRFSDNECKVACEYIHNKATELITDLADYAIDATILNNFKGLILQFEEKMNKPQVEINITKLATNEIANLFKNNSILLAKMDLLVLVVRYTKPEFYKAYFESRAIDRAPSRKLSIRIFVTNEQGHLIPEARIKNESLNINRKTSQKGVMYLKNIEEGTYEFTVSKLGYESKTVSVAVGVNERTDAVVILN